MRPPQDDIKRLCAWRKRVNRGVYHDKEVSDSAKAAFRRAAYQTERTVKRMGRNDFREGEYIIYVNGEQYEIGRIKSLTDSGAFVAYHEGETGAKTPYSHMHKLINEYTIIYTTLGGDYFERDREGHENAE